MEEGGGQTREWIIADGGWQNDGPGPGQDIGQMLKDKVEGIVLRSARVVGRLCGE
jgi:hypothetical protein